LLNWQQSFLSKPGNGIELIYTQEELYEIILALADGYLEYRDLLCWVIEHQG